MGRLLNCKILDWFKAVRHITQLSLIIHIPGRTGTAAWLIVTTDDEIWTLSRVTPPTDEMIFSSGVSQSHRGDELFEIVQ